MRDALIPCESAHRGHPSQPLHPRSHRPPRHRPQSCLPLEIHRSLRRQRRINRGRQCRTIHRTKQHKQSGGGVPVMGAPSVGLLMRVCPHVPTVRIQHLHYQVRWSFKLVRVAAPRSAATTNRSVLAQYVVPGSATTALWSTAASQHQHSNLTVSGCPTTSELLVSARPCAPIPVTFISACSFIVAIPAAELLVPISARPCAPIRKLSFIYILWSICTATGWCTEQADAMLLLSARLFPS